MRPTTANGHTRPADPEPIAIVGMGCRFPGDATSLHAFWRLLTGGMTGIGELPPGRWEPYRAANPENASALRTATTVGGFIANIDGFDAEFFGTSPREAGLMDPQQRMALEVAWEALEHAGIVPASLAGSDVGVYMGVNTDDHGRRLLEDLPRIEAWTGVGSSLCIVANRVSYALDLRGPSMAVDTACSSSLVAIHLACQSLSLGETPLAIAGGVMLMAAPGLTMVMDAAGALSPDGRSKSFDASADGYGRGEGCGVIVLKRLADARRDGDRVLAVIRGTAVHQDGRTNGIMAPSGVAQEHLLREAYRRAEVSPDTIDYVEAHGTGTPVGDPLEAGAMAAVFGAGRPAGAPCLIGSVKTNIGHLEAASGAAGVIKAVLALDAAEIPPSLNITEPNPQIPWETAGLRVVTEPTPWPRTDHPRRAGVSGYGYGGTIAHLILEQAPDAERAVEDTVDGQPRVYPLTGNSAVAVQAYAGRLADWLSGPGAGTSLADVGHTLAHRRTHLDWRTTVVAADRGELIARLRDVATENPTNTVSAARVLDAAADPGVVWVFSGHGAQWVGMGRELLDTEPVFGAVLDELAPIFQEEAGFTPRRLLGDGDLHDTDRIQPAIFAMQVALAEVWRSYGVRPSAVIGHSVGEIAAAVVAGGYELHDGARLICRRSTLLRRVAGRGTMAMVNLSFDEVTRRLAGRDDVVAAIAASSTSTVVAGDIAAVEELARRWSGGDVLVQRVDSDVAFHSPHMDPLLDELAASVAELRPREPDIPIYVTALDDSRARPNRDGRYWAANLRNPVRFADAVRAAIHDGYRVFLEVAAHPVVSYNIDEVLTAAGIEESCVAGSLRRGRAERETLLANLGKLYCRGVPIDWDRAAPDGSLGELPPIAWRHRDYRPEARPRRANQVRAHNVESHTLLGGDMTVRGTSTARLWQTYLDSSSRPYPGDHPVHGVEIVPAAVLLNTFFAAATGDGAPPVLTDVVLRTPVTVTSPRELQVLRQGNSVLRLSSRLLDSESDADGEDGWLTHTTAVARPVAETDWVGDHTLPVATLRERCTERLDPGFVIERLASIGVAAMGFPWRIEELTRGDGELLARVVATPDTSWASVLDAALSAASVAFAGPPTLRMPAQIRQVAVAGPPPAEALVSMRALGTDTVDVDIATVDGRVVARLSGLRYGLLDGDIGAPANPRRLVHELVWPPLELERSTEDIRLAVVVGDGALAEPLAAEGVRTIAVGGPEELDGLRAELDGATAVLVSPPESADPVGSAWLLARTARRLSELDTAARLWVVTRGVRHGAALGHSPLWGLGRIVAGEHPELWGGIVDLDGVEPAESSGVLLAVLRARPDEDVIALTPGGVLTSRLASLQGEPIRAPMLCRPEGTYLITGGLGVLGLEVANWLADRGARRLVLAGRHALPPRARWDQVDDPALAERIRAVRGLEAVGVTVQTVALDITDRARATELLSPGALGLPPIRGVVHAAGTLDSRMLRDVDEESLRRVMAPKVDGALVLHELFPPGSVDFFVLFSSCGPLLGLPGQASYAAANAFLDALAHRRDDAISFGWTSWRGLGMSTSSALIDAELAARGTADITATEAFRAWEYAERFGVAHLAVLRLLPDAPDIRRPALLRDLTVSEPAGERAVTAADPPWADLPAWELHAYLVGEVCRQVAAEMKLAPDELDVRRALSEMGLDSVMTLIIRRRLERQFRLSLPATLLWNRPTVLAVADYLAELLSEVDNLGETAEAA